MRVAVHERIEHLHRRRARLRIVASQPGEGIIALRADRDRHCRAAAPHAPAGVPDQQQQRQADQRPDRPMPPTPELLGKGPLRRVRSVRSRARDGSAPGSSSAGAPVAGKPSPGMGGRSSPSGDCAAAPPKTADRLEGAGGAPEAAAPPNTCVRIAGEGSADGGEGGRADAAPPKTWVLAAEAAWGCAGGAPPPPNTWVRAAGGGSGGCPGPGAPPNTWVRFAGGCGAEGRGGAPAPKTCVRAGSDVPEPNAWVRCAPGGAGGGGVPVGPAPNTWVEPDAGGLCPKASVRIGPAVRAALPKGSVPEGAGWWPGVPAPSPPRWAVNTSPQRVHCTGAPPAGTRRSSSA